MVCTTSQAGYDNKTNWLLRSAKVVKLCGPLAAVAMVRDKQGRGWCQPLELRDHDKRMRRILLPDSALDGEGRDVTSHCVMPGYGLPTTSRLYSKCI